MRETDFIGQNKEKWSDFEKILNKGSADAEKLSRLFIETTDDLSFSRTYYPNRSVRVYLNGIAQQVYHRIYKHRKRSRGNFKRFWHEELPDAIWHARKALLASFLIFVIGFGIGMFSSANDPGFVNTILGDSYVAMTENNIANGKPLGVYAKSDPVEMFLTIAWNNIQVGILCFLLGVLFEVGTIFIVFSNAVMVGAFIWFFIERNLFRESFFAIMLHGTLELSMIVLAGAAGLTLGRGLVFPGSYTRLQAFLLSARHGIRIMLGVSAFLLVAAFIEGFATRYTDAPDLIRGLVILLSMSIVIGYFVWYPYQRYRKGLTKEMVETETIPESTEDLRFNAIKTNGQIINDGWRLFLSGIKQHLGTAIGATVLFIVFLLVYLGEDFLGLFISLRFYSEGIILDLLDGFWFWDEAVVYFSFARNPFLFLPLAVMFGLIFIVTFRVFQKGTSSMVRVRDRKFMMDLLNGLTAGCVLLLPFFTSGSPSFPGILTVVICLFWWPFWLVIAASAFIEGRFLFNSIGTGFALMRGRFGSILGVFLSQGLVLWAGMAIVGAPLFYVIYQIIGLNFAANTPGIEKLIFILQTLFTLSGLGTLIAVMIHSMLSIYFSNIEINTAHTLRKSIAEMALKSKAYGLEKDV